MQDDVCDAGWVCIDGKCHCSEGSEPPTERPRLECRRVYMRMFARSGTFNLRFRHLNSQRFSRSHSHFVHPAPVVLPHAQPSVPTHLVLHHALSSHMSSYLDQHRRLCVGVHAKLNVWCRACRSQVLGHRLRSGFVCVRREGVRGSSKRCHAHLARHQVVGSSLQQQTQNMSSHMQNMEVWRVTDRNVGRLRYQRTLGFVDDPHDT